ncbi:methylenetetrahydrofolate reductase [Amycolatopsis sp. OK19-0408]|uniref:Methylenetetrahydrofolate reductase n=1 Tax=Amycolatopsis iheyensis TaxID=2945988 RepID=A0A9X2SP34_9PSEU|nr:methylenetetrahydrofolate reductase [Amycolatopsis iheyensis]MCR6487766.1 methylenetetrahydrofolate reductase [Amycolatopsis iheyensis]
MPPRAGDDAERIWQNVRRLESLHPGFVSVTYGAGGSTRDNTVAVAARIARETTMLPVVHLTAVDHSVRQLRSFVGALADAGVTDVLALRGDPPGDVTGEWVRHPEGLSYASELVTLLREHGDFCVGVAAFPFGHPRSASPAEDTARFVAKCRAGADYAITQMVFDADDYLRLRDRVAAAGCATPIIPALMPVTTMKTIARSEQLSGAPFPPSLAARFAAVADDPAAVRALGIEQAILLARRLLAEGVPGLHFITFNFARATTEVVAELPVFG